MAAMSLIKYRPDIDGLRALAVLMVVLFHADIKPFKGGFVGVDIFFVISGYLITSLILKDLGKGEFSLLQFWERRIRRILPALTAVVLVTFAAGLFMFLPNDLVGLGKQTAWQSISASNFYFWRQVNYFNTEHELQPLLHTWSLAVEEQFYFLFPLLAVFLWRKAGSRTVTILWGLTLFSFGASLWAISYYPSAAFFLLPFRAWELLTGALLAYHKPNDLPGKWREGAALAGFAMLLLAGILYTSRTDFPGLTALLPCIGAALLIWTGQGGTIVSRALSYKVPVFIGLISYSWYLWHWPVLCFAEYVLQDNLDKTGKLICVGVSFGLAILSWKFIEQPFRRPGGVLSYRPKVFTAAFVTLAMIALAGSVVIAGKGLPQRLSPEARNYADGFSDRYELRAECEKKKYDRLLQNDVCEANPGSGKKPTFVLWGDSQAEAIIPAFVTLSKKYGTNGYLAVKAGCPPILDIHHEKNDNKRPYCRDFNAAHFRFIREQKIKDVFFVANWSSWVRNKELSFENPEWYETYRERYDNILMAGVQRTVDALQADGVRVHFVINQPSMRFDPPRALAVGVMTGLGHENLYFLKQEYLSLRIKDLDNFIAQNEGKDFIVYDMAPILCPADKCLPQHDGHSFYFDKGHLSAYGANYVSSIFEDFFRKRN